MDSAMVGETASNYNTTTTNPPNNWTDEKHLDFLSAMEATFVRTMLMQVQSSAPTTAGRRHHQHRQEEEELVLHHHHQHQQQQHMNSSMATTNSSCGSFRLDRYVPDMSESTLDLHTESNKNTNNNSKRRRSIASNTTTKSAAASVVMRRERMIQRRSSTRNISTRQRRIRLAPTSHQDQVVPQLLMLQDK